MEREVIEESHHADAFGPSVLPPSNRNSHSFPSLHNDTPNQSENGSAMWPSCDNFMKRSFAETFFNAVPLFVHPIIILRLLCHKMFGNMLRRKNKISTQNLSPPPVIMANETCPPRSPNDTNEADTSAANSKKEALRKRRTNLHVQIASDKTDEDTTSTVIPRNRTCRAASIDKSLLRMGNGTMSMAIKAIGDSLVSPLDLNINKKSHLMDSGDIYAELKTVGGKRMFRFPSMKKTRMSKSHGHLSQIGKSESEDLEDVDHRSPDHDVRAFQKELINLPTFEMDTGEFGHQTSPLLKRMDSPLISRCNSVPERLEGAALTDQVLITPVPSVCEISVTRNEDDNGMNIAGSPGDSPQLSLNGSPLLNDLGEAIVVHFAAASPIESPSSGRSFEEPTSPLLPRKFSLDQNTSTGVTSMLPHSMKSVNSQLSPPIENFHRLLPLTTSVSSHQLVTSTSLHSGVSQSSASPHSEHSHSTLFYPPSPTVDIPSQHRSVMKVVETWINICRIDLESTNQVQREMKDFLNKMASLGPEYKTWSHSIYNTLKLEVRTTPVPSPSREEISQNNLPCWVGLMVSVSASHTVGCGFASRPGHTKDHHKNGTNCLLAWHAMC